MNRLMLVEKSGGGEIDLVVRCGSGSAMMRVQRCKEHYLRRTSEVRG